MKKKRLSKTARERASGRAFQESGSADPELLWGRSPAKEVLRYRSQTVKEIYRIPQFKGDAELEELLRSSLPEGISAHVLSPRELDELCRHDKHQGIVLRVLAPQTLGLEALIQKKPQLLVILDQVQDPQNLGSVLRAAEGAGADGLIVPERRTAPLSGVARKASAGASELLDISRVSNVRTCLERLKQEGFWIMGTSLAEGSQSIYEVEVPRPTAVVFGSEGKGLRPLVEKSCDFLVSIPMRGQVQSLNVGQAVAVVLFELARPRAGR